MQKLLDLRSRTPKEDAPDPGARRRLNHEFYPPPMQNHVTSAAQRPAERREVSLEHSNTLESQTQVHVSPQSGTSQQRARIRNIEHRQNPTNKQDHRKWSGELAEHPENADSLLEQLSKEIDTYEATKQLVPVWSTTTRLNELKRQILNDDTTPRDQMNQCRMGYYLARLHVRLGSYADATLNFCAALPDMFQRDDDGELHMESPVRWGNGIFHEHHITYLMVFLSFLLGSHQNLVLAEEILDMVPWLGSTEGKITLTDSARWVFMLYSIQLANAQHNYAKASRLLDALDNWNWTDHAFGDIILIARERALRWAGSDRFEDHERAYHEFAKVLTLSMTGFGAWHIQTLTILYHLGKVLGQLGNYSAACLILQKACLGFLFRFGSAHPDFQRSYRELHFHDQSGSFVRPLSRFKSLSAEEQISIAFEIVCFDTAIDILMHVPGVDFVELKRTIDWRSFDNLADMPIPIQVNRTLARLNEEVGDYKDALKMVAPIKHTDARPFDNIVLEFDRLRIASRYHGPNVASDQVQALLLNATQLTGLSHRHGRLRALYRQLNALDVMHIFPRPRSPGSTLVEEEKAEILGIGTYATVDRVRVGHELYARKSIPLPRFHNHQQRMRKAIQNEVSIVRTLDHPHIIKVFFTYEMNARFCIIMEPLADCDLEAFLIQHSSKPPTESQRVTLWKWLLCLSNTLAFIHSRGVRHKDIKSRNILIKNHEVIFADFGSSHAFLDGGDSTTEGPSYGHTKMYCAPEVIENQSRNRSADIFSLGCVFTELAVWLAGVPGFDINDWHAYRHNSDSGTSAYYASLEKVKEWFRQCDNEPILRLYRIIIEKMLGRNPEKRLAAIVISASIRMLIDQDEMRHPLELTSCSKCSFYPWVDDKSIPAPTL